MGDLEFRVLYVDDDDALVRLVQKALGRFGIIVEHAATVDAALARSSAGDIHVIALDHYLGGGTGLDLLARLANVPTAPPVVYVTGTSEMQVAVAALKAGASDFVPKTVGDEFLILLRSSLEQAVDKARLKNAKEAAEEEVRRARDRAVLFLAEMNHRIANGLSLVASLVNLQANAIEDQVAKDALAETQARIFAISLVHKRLYTTGEVGHVALDEYLLSLLEHLVASMRRDGHGANLVSFLEPLALSVDSSINLGIVATEWVTNAFKYAYPDSEGEVRVRLRRLADGRGELSVEDDGVGRDDGATAKGTGLGTRIVKAMSTGMDAETVYVSLTPGTAARISFPLASR